MISANKGEWSEIYVFLRLLADGRLNAADANLNALPNIFYPIITILRDESSGGRKYYFDDEIKITEDKDNELLKIPLITFIDNSKRLFSLIKSSKGRSFSFPEIETFLLSIDVNSVKASGSKKSDIKIILHDIKTGKQPELGFSIKSMIGGSSTLFNAGNTTNFIYEIVGDGELSIDKINEIESQPKIANRLAEVKKRGFKIAFRKIQSETFELNLKLIDSSLPEILAEFLLVNYTTAGLTYLSNALEKLIEENPLNFDLSMGHPFYEYKLKSFLTDTALGMTPATIWTGKYDATGGIIIVKDDGELVCYHIYNRSEFQEYLINNTKFEQASTSRYSFGDLYQQDGKIFIKLNLQIRFK